MNDPIATDFPVLTLLPLDRRIPLLPGRTLLEAARAAGVVLRSSCRNGTCRACIARVTAGSVRHRIEWPGVTREERAEGWALPCIAEADADVTLVQPLVDAVADGSRHEP